MCFEDLLVHFSVQQRHSDYLKVNKNYSNFFSFQSAEMKASVFLGVS